MKVSISISIFFLAMNLLMAQDYSMLKRETEDLLKKELDKEDIHNAFLTVYSPSKNIKWNFAVGNFQNGNPVTISHPFYAASIGKTVTATAIAILYEQHKLDFNDKISMHLPQYIYSGIHTLEGKNFAPDITIAQLLQHTSGMADYFSGATHDDSPNALMHLFMDTSRFWQPVEMLEIVKNKMNPNFEPGAGYMYTDTEYILLGLIIENISGMPLRLFLIENIFFPLDMKNTYMYLRSKPLVATPKLAEIYAEETDVSGFTSLSLDWAGGGLVTTGDDLNKFQVALHTHKIIEEETLVKMQQWVPESKGTYYGFGLRKVQINELFPSLPDMTMIGHTGSTASFMFYSPELDVYLSGTLNQLSRYQKSISLPINILTRMKKEEW